MSNFTNNPIIEITDKEIKNKVFGWLVGTQCWVKTKVKIVYHKGSYPSDIVYTVPPEFTTDLETIPWVLRLFFPKISLAVKAAILHDYLLKYRKRLKLSRKDCDDTFLEAMKVSGVGHIRRHLMYLGVRVYGIIKGDK